MASIAISPSILLAATKNTGIPKVHLTLSSTPIVAGPRKLKEIWTCECSHKLNAYYSIKTDEELQNN